MGNNTSSPLILNTDAPQGCVLSPLLYSLYTHDCIATHSSNVIVKFADDTTVIGLITDNNETADREEVSTLTKWCQENHFSLNIDKTKSCRWWISGDRAENTPITIDKTPVERVNCFKFLCVHITLHAPLATTKLYKRVVNCPPHCWRWASLPPGYLHQAVHEESPEDHQWLQPPVPQSALSAALRKTSPQHPIPH